MPAAHRNRELLLTFGVAFVIVALYLAIVRRGVPSAGSPLGHWMGVVGFVLMLGAETLYSFRKQARGPARGRMSTWLEAHVVMGLIGPLLVLLHSAWGLAGLAGWTMVLTALMVVSGFVCRYIYTALPRSLDGLELSRPELAQEMATANRQLDEWSAAHPAARAALGDRLASVPRSSIEDDAFVVLARSLLHWRYQRRLRRDLSQLPDHQRAAMAEIIELLDRRYTLETYARSLAVARRLLSLSRAVHIALGVVVFLLAFVHIGAALYYVTLAR